MNDPDSKPKPETDAAVGLSFFSELRKRRVYQSAVAYAVVAWGITEVLDGVVSGLGWPEWLATLAVIVFVTGFPAAMFLAWVYDWTPEGIRRTASSGPMGWLPAAFAILFLVAGSAGLFWLINPSGVVRTERIGVAVLPCRYRGDPERAFRGEGIARQLNARLAYSDNLFVPSFESTRSLAATHPDTQALARQLGVAFFVDCRVTDEGDGMRLTTSLVDIDSDESRELSSTNLKSIEILDALRAAERGILRALGLPPAERREYGLFTTSLGAFDQYLIGLQAMRGGTVASLEEARKRFREAQAPGPFTLARVYEAEAFMARLEIAPPPEASRPAVLRAVDLILDEVELSENAPAELYAARLRFANLGDRFGWEPPVSAEQRREWFERAIARRPSFAPPYLRYAEHLERTGRDAEAVELREQAEKLMPFR